MIIVRRPLCAVALLAFLSFVPRQVSAQSSAYAPNANDQATARLKEGLTLANQGKWEDARLAFVQAYAVIPSVDLLWNLAYAELKSGHAMDALKHFKAYERDRKAEAPRIAMLPALREQAYRQIGRIQIDAPSGSTVWIDGAEPMVASAGPIDVAPGEHTIAVKSGEHTVERTFSAEAGQVTKMTFSLPEGQPSAPNNPTQTQPASPEQPRTSSSAKYWVVGGFGLAAVATASLAVGFGVAASNDQTKVDQFRSTMQPWCDPMTTTSCASWEQWHQAADDQRSHARTANVLFASAGALLVGGAITWLVWPRSPTTVGFAASPGLASLGVAHAF